MWFVFYWDFSCWSRWSFDMTALVMWASHRTESFVMCCFGTFVHIINCFQVSTAASSCYSNFACFWVVPITRRYSDSWLHSFNHITSSTISLQSTLVIRDLVSRCQATFIQIRITLPTHFKYAIIFVRFTHHTNIKSFVLLVTILQWFCYACTRH